MTDRELMQQALEAEEAWESDCVTAYYKMKSLGLAPREALTQTVQKEPDTTYVDDALREVAETEDDIAAMEIPAELRTQLERIRLDLGASPFVTLTDDMIKWVLLANERAQPQPAQQEHIGEVTNMPGANGFTVAIFESAKVPAGTKVYTAPQPAQQPAMWCPDVCPITGMPFFMWIEHHETGQMVPTYGGPHDSYTIPVRGKDGAYCRERYDHDEGGWLTDEVEDVGVQIVSDQAHVSDEQCGVRMG